MKEIKDLLKNFKIPVPPEKTIENIINDFIKNKNKKIKISLQNKSIFIKGDAYSKREILLQQKQILLLIKEKLPKTTIEKIV